jgi:hypothetical protein
VEAAIWNLRLAPINDTMNIPTITTSTNSNINQDFLPENAKQTIKGIHIILELIGSNISTEMEGTNNNSSMFSSNNDTLLLTQSSEIAVLACQYSAIKQASDLALITYSQLADKKIKETVEEREDPSSAMSTLQDALESAIRFTIVWEICPESWINDELDFLDRFLS